MSPLFTSYPGYAVQCPSAVRDAAAAHVLHPAPELDVVQVYSAQPVPLITYPSLHVAQ